MKKIYVAPLMEKKTITTRASLLLPGSNGQVDMGDAAGDGEEITADAREENHNHNIWDIEW